ncbi:MAG: hypothetical protein CMF74_08740 [Maricaulis sp.]|jgi:cytoplasmic iron level regulating protein YaaA (DUF328/UPF0246 family)|nr:hypothetical protein [Maricaulis sp.]
MLVLLSPAKRLNFDPSAHTLGTTRPALIDRTADLSRATAKLSKRKIKTMMDLSDDLAELNWQRFQALDPDSTDGKPAALAFAGEVYRGLNAEGLTDADLTWAQDHLRILSGLYGVLRPLDVIQPYRLEMGRKIKTKKGESLYDFWGSDIAAELNEALNGQKSRAIVNLASNEYFRAVDRKTLDAEIVDVDFKEEKDGKARILFMFAKVARGLMARWIIENRVTDPGKLKDFDIEGYRFDEPASETGPLTFVRPQPPKKRAA